MILFRKALLFAVASLLAGALASDVNAVWPTSLGGPGNDEITDSLTDSDGNLYVTGVFSGVAHFGGDSTLSARGGQDIFVARYNSAGQLDWARRAGSTGIDRSASIARDEGGNIYITGHFFGQADFGGTDLFATTAQASDLFVAKLSSSGNWLWAKSAGGDNNVGATSIVVVPGNQQVAPPVPAVAVLGGYFECQAEFRTPASPPFDDVLIELDNAAECTSDERPEQYFVAGIDADGVWQWALSDDEFGFSGRIIDLDVSVDGSVAALVDAEVRAGDFLLDGGWTVESPGYRAVPQLDFLGLDGREDPVPRVNTLLLNQDFDFSAGVSNPQLFLFHTVDIDPFADYPDCSNLATVEYSLDGGDSWIRVPPNWVSGQPFNGNQVADGPGSIGGSGWCEPFMPLSPFLPTVPLVSLVALQNLVGEESVRVRLLHSETSFVPWIINALGFGAGGWRVLQFSLLSDQGDLYGGITETRASFVGRLSNLASGDPQWSFSNEVEPGLTLNSIRFGQQPGDPIYATGAVNQPLTLPDGSQLSEVGAAIVALSTLDGDWLWGRSFDGGVGRDLVLDGNDLFFGGEFEGSITFSADDDSLDAEASRDLFVAKASAADGSIIWATGGNRYNASGGIPAKAGGTGDANMTSIAFDGQTELYVAGSFSEQLVFGEDAELFAPAGRDAYIASISTQGGFFEVQGWTIGEPIAPPANANVSNLAAPPDIFIDGQKDDQAIGNGFYWGVPQETGIGQLIPLDSYADVQVHWRIQNEPPESDARAIEVGSTSWPTTACSDGNDSACYQVHVAGAPVEIEEPGSGFRYIIDRSPAFLSSGGAVDAGVFNAGIPGFHVLTYVEGTSTDIQRNPVAIEVVRTLIPQQAPGFVRNVAWTIGEPIVEPFHNQPGRTGYVINENAFYDGVGDDAAYDRAARTGHIIPVNKVRRNRLQDSGKEMLVAWYRRNAKGVYWPRRVIEYAPDWALDPERIIIASEQGAENLGQQPLSPNQFPELRIYQQPVPGLPGYKPNATHAFFAPSNTGSGILALFALRADFGINIPDDATAATDPYVLVKYFDTALNRWAYRTFYVSATGAGFDAFEFSGVAGTAVNPPYPVSLLPGCPGSRAVGQATNEPPPPPFFTDYKNGLWSKSAGSGGMLFEYPLQPGMDYDINNNDMPNASAGDCVPWMARLRESAGGTEDPTVPIEVSYTFTWPSDAPQLIPGETLLTQKRGLPNILQQDAVQVVFDERREVAAEDQPEDSLVQLIDPLNPRFVILDALEGVSTELDPETGWRVITGSGDGLTSLPVSIRQRLRYDPINQRLIFSGVFDDSIAGDPLLLLNVMSFRDARQLKVLDGSEPDADEDLNMACDSLDDECSWSQAIEALLRLTRNPNRIERICTDSEIDEISNTRSCLLSRPVARGELLTSFEDPGGEGLIQPFQAVGVQPALTAGAARDTGWVTVAFNNDPTLDPAPVSLSIIRVDCLAPDVLDLDFPYQGQLNVIMPDNIFDEQLTLRHGGDFGGNPDALDFDWYFQPDLDGLPPSELPDPESGQLNGWFQIPVDDSQGAIEVVIEGANIQTLSDNWYLARYRGLPVCGNVSRWSLWAGQPGSTATDQRAQLGQGWVNRVIARLNPFEARVQDFHSSPTNTYASMLIQLGERYEGDIPLTSNPEVLNEIGLIEAYTTVMRRALDLSVNATPPVDYGPVNNAILNVASRLVDFYALLGNEAYADAQDPTIGLLTSGEFESFAPTIFPFQNQVASLLEEELVLLRGRDASQATTRANPVYNRFFWNFTTGDGEVAYALNYGISDQNQDGVIDEFDARIQYPQGHGDAWGHYLTAVKTHYELLRNPFFTWVPRPDAVPVAGVPLQVDFFDERKFATVAAAKARTGAEIVNLTYRQAYVEDPNAQWQGYKDDDQERAWGLSEWARRAGQGAYFDWVVGNAILPSEDPNPGNGGIQRIERGTVSELEEIIGQFDSIQTQIDQADRGLNPLGLARDVVPFDIDPSRVDNGETHFEQVFSRAETALDNAVESWNFANQLNRMLRFNQDSVEDLAANASATEIDFKNRLIEIFGYPYADDIGPGGVYPTNYDGPDLYHYMYIDVLELAGEDTNLLDGFDVEGDLEISRFDTFWAPMEGGLNHFDIGSEGEFTADCGNDPQAEGCALGDRPAGEESLEIIEMVTYTSPAFGTTFGKPPEWTGRRRATGSLQNVLHDMFMARLDLSRTLLEYEQLRQQLVEKIDELGAVFNIREAQLQIANNERSQLNTLGEQVLALQETAAVTKTAGEIAADVSEVVSECIPKTVIAGLAFGGDGLSAGRCAIKGVGIAAKSVTAALSQGFSTAAAVVENSIEDVSLSAAINSQILDDRLELFGIEGEFDELLRREPLLRVEIFKRAEAVEALQRKYQQQLAEGQRALTSLIRFRKEGAAATQEYRYQDMAFRIFRNDALQKYRATFDLAARYVYLAAATYDYETNLLGSDQKAGQRFLTDIVRERSIGQIIGGSPVAGSRGLADPMARMSQNFEVLKGQMGFNNPQIETNRFSLRRELFRIDDDEDGDEAWRQTLEEARVDNLWNLPEFRRFARPPQPESAGPLPGLVFRFPTTVTFGLNFFHWPLGSGDSTYDPTRFSTKVRGVGTWFRDYAGLPLTETPRIYMFPVGADVLRAPSFDDFTTRQWQVIDQVLPVPFPIGSQELQNANWIPMADSLSNSFNEIRRYSQFRAHHFSEPFDESQIATDSRLIGRSVWNREWVVIIPGGSLLADANEGLNTFIYGEEIDGERDGLGVSDIRIFFNTYSYSGN